MCLVGISSEESHRWQRSSPSETLMAVSLSSLPLFTQTLKDGMVDILIPETCKYCCMGKRTLQMRVIKRSLYGKVILDYLGGPKMQSQRPIEKGGRGMRESQRRCDHGVRGKKK